ncbi:MAG TPA: host attachment protein [Casimicrobiaceae bacterium]|nr:host attachment protein [Casimicrobiaceae bacterium]
MKRTWILAADGSRARIYEVHAPDKTPQQIEEFDNPQGRAHNRDLVTDGNGRYFGKGEHTQGHTAPPNETAVEHEVELFAKRLAAHLEKGRVEQKFDRLRLVAAPKFLGLLRQNLTKELDKLVDESIAKDVSWFDESSLAEYLKDKAA